MITKYKEQQQPILSQFKTLHTRVMIVYKISNSFVETYLSYEISKCNGRVIENNTTVDKLGAGANEGWTPEILGPLAVSFHALIGTARSVGDRVVE